MRSLTVTKLIPAVGIILLLTLASGTVLAHEQREVGKYSFVVGFLVEPAYEGLKNGVFLSVTKIGTEEGEMSMEMDMDTGMDVEEHGAIFGSPGLAPGESFSFEVTHELEDLTIPYHSHENHDLTGSITVSDTAEVSGTVEIKIHNAMIMPAEISVQPGTTLVWTNEASSPQTATSGLAPGVGHTHEAEEMEIPLEGLEETLQVEITHVPTDASRTLSLRPMFGQPGQYTADLIPTVPGIYEFRIFGTIEGTEVNESFVSAGGGGGFDDIESSVALQFPETLPQVREIEAAVRGAQSEAQEARDVAIEADDSASSASILAIVGIVLGAVGVVAGAGSAAVVLRRR